MSRIIPSEVFAEGFHTGFRKGSDTEYANLMWHLIKRTPHPIWSHFCGKCEKKLTKKILIDKNKLKSHCLVSWNSKIFEQEFFWRTRAGRREYNHKLSDKLSTDLYIFDYALKCTPDEIWEDIADWFKFCFEVWEE